MASSSRKANLYPVDDRVFAFTPDMEEIQIMPQETYKGNYKGWTACNFIYSKNDRAAHLTLLVRLIKLSPELVVYNPDPKTTSPLCITYVDGEEVKSLRMELMGFERQIRKLDAVRGVCTLEKVVTDAKRTVAVTFPGRDTWEYLYKRYMSRFTGETGAFLNLTGSPSIIAYLLPLCAIPNMTVDLDGYRDNPDPRGVEFVDPMNKTQPKPVEKTDEYDQLVTVDAEICSAFGYPVDEKDYPCPVNQPPLASVVVNTEDELTALAFVHIFMMVKKGQDQHVTTALRKRLGALRQATGLESLDIDSFMERFGRVTVLSKAADRLTFYPRLRSTIFSSIISHDSPFHSYTREILKDTQLTIFNMIVVFCGAQQLTMLHVIDPVLAEYDCFMDAKDHLATIYGEQTWHYCKLLNPSENLATLSRFPELARAAKAYMVTHHHMESLRNLQGMRDVPRMYYQFAAQSIMPVVRVDIEVVKQKLGRIALPDVVNSITDAMLQEGKRAAETRELDPQVIAFITARQE